MMEYISDHETKWLTPSEVVELRAKDKKTPRGDQYQVWLTAEQLGDIWGVIEAVNKQEIHYYEEVKANWGDNRAEEQCDTLSDLVSRGVTDALREAAGEVLPPRTEDVPLLKDSPLPHKLTGRI